MLTFIRLVRQAKQPGEGLPVFTIVTTGRPESAKRIRVRGAAGKMCPALGQSPLR